MKIALISHLFPNQRKPFLGKFIRDHVDLLTESEEYKKVGLFVPTPYSFPYTKRWRNNHADLNIPDDVGERVYYLSFPRKRLPKLIRKSLSANLINSLSEENYDLVHIHWLYPDGMSVPALAKAGYKCVLTVHGSDFYKNTENEKLMSMLEESIRSSIRILCSGDQLKYDLINRFPEATNKTVTIYNYVSESRYHLTTGNFKEQSLRKLKWHEDALHILCVANIRYEKGIDVLTDAVKDLKLNQPATLHIIGQDSNDAYSQKIGEEIGEWTNPDLDIHLHKPVPPSALMDYYRAADLFVLPSRNEGFNVSILEAMATGLPVVATRVGGADKVVNADNGILVESEDPDALKNAIIEVTNKLADYDREAIRNRILTEFGEKIYLKRLSEVYKYIVE